MSPRQYDFTDILQNGLFMNQSQVGMSFDFWQVMILLPVVLLRHVLWFWPDPRLFSFFESGSLFLYRRKIITYSISYMSILYEGYRRIEWHFKENSAVKNLPCTFIRTRDLSTRVCLTSCWLVTTFNSFWFSPHRPFQVASTLRGLASAAYSLCFGCQQAFQESVQSPEFLSMNSSVWINFTKKCFVSHESTFD